ncbi:hypothetical protein Aperf_G00000094060 [Anoplocephala perfoliata]
MSTKPKIFHLLLRQYRERCEEGFNPCKEHIREHNGTCVRTGEHMNFADCVNCSSEWGGVYCERRLNSCELEILNLSHSPCANGGNRLVNPIDVTTYICLCAPSWQGKRCENLYVKETMMDRNEKSLSISARPKVVEEKDYYKRVKGRFQSTLKPETTSTSSNGNDPVQDSKSRNESDLNSGFVAKLQILYKIELQHFMAKLNHTKIEIS